MTTRQQPSALERGQKPWKYIGWPGYTRFAASDDDFLILRRFDISSTRVLLSMQDNVARLEESLEKIDEESSALSAPDVNNGSFRRDKNVERVQLLQELKSALLEYKQFLWFHSQLKAQPFACEESKQNAEAWIWNHPGAIVQEEASFMSASDLINIVPRQRSQTRKLLELLQVFKLRRIFGTKGVNSEPYAITYSDTRLESLVIGLQLVLGLAMLNAPLWVLSYVGNATARLAFISGSIVLFLVLVTLLTPAKVPEALAATAAYSAVLMVFWQVNPG